MMKSARRRTPSGGVQDALVAAALRLLEAEGPEALSVRRVAAEAGVAPMGVYNHFEGKNGVVDALFRTGFATLTESLEAVVARTADDDPADALREGLRHYRTLALEHPRAYEVMFLCAIPGFEPSEESHEVAAGSFDVLVQAIARGMQAGAFLDDDPRLVAQQLWAACHGAVALEIAEIGKIDDTDRVYEALLETLVRGISAPRDRAGSPGRAARPARAR